MNIVHALVQRLAKARFDRLATLPTVRRRQLCSLLWLVITDASSPGGEADWPVATVDKGVGNSATKCSNKKFGYQVPTSSKT